MPPSGSRPRSDVSLTELDLTPDAPSDGLPGRRRSAPLRNWLLILGVVAALGFVLTQALTSARVYFLNVDEAVAQRTELAEDTFRMQGVVSSERTTDASGAMVFTMTFNDVTAEVTHIGEEPTDLFEWGQPVVAEGHWQGDRFVSNQILVKHSESYVADNTDRPGVGDTPVTAPADGPAEESLDDTSTGD